MGVIVSILLVSWTIKTILSKEGPSIGLNRTWFLILPFGLICAWIGIQMAPWTPESWHHPLWKSTSNILGMELQGSISLVPFESGSALLRLLTFVGIFWLAMQYGRDSQNALRMVKAIAIASGIYATYGLIVEFTGTKTILWFDKEYYQNNLTSTFRYKNAYATYAGMGLLCTIALIVRSVHAQVRYDDGKFETRRRVYSWLLEKGWIPVLTALIILSSLILSDSRAGLLSSGCAVLVLFAAFRISHMKRIPYLRSITSIAVVAIIAFFYVGGKEVTDRFSTLGTTGETTRSKIYKATKQAIEDVAILGSGAGTYDEVFPIYNPKSIKLRILRAHSTYLENAMELGLPASSLLILMLGGIGAVCAYGAYSRRRQGIYPCIGLGTVTLIGFHATVDFTMQVPAIAATFCALIGVGYAQSRGSIAND